MHRALGEGGLSDLVGQATGLGAWFAGLMLAGLYAPLLSQLLRSPTALPLGNLLGRPGDAGRCWACSALLGTYRGAFVGVASHAVPLPVLSPVPSSVPSSTTATAATVLQYDVHTTC